MDFKEQFHPPADRFVLKNNYQCFSLLGRGKHFQSIWKNTHVSYFFVSSEPIPWNNLSHRYSIHWCGTEKKINKKCWLSLVNPYFYPVNLWVSREGEWSWVSTDTRALPAPPPFNPWIFGSFSHFEALSAIKRTIPNISEYPRTTLGYLGML